VDAVLLCTQHKFHAEQIAAAAHAGKHVFCEKPLTVRAEDAVHVLDAGMLANVRSFDAITRSAYSGSVERLD